MKHGISICLYWLTASLGVPNLVEITMNYLGDVSIQSVFLELLEYLREETSGSSEYLAYLNNYLTNSKAVSEGTYLYDMVKKTSGLVQADLNWIKTLSDIMRCFDSDGYLYIQFTKPIWDRSMAEFVCKLINLCTYEKIHERFRISESHNRDGKPYYRISHSGVWDRKTYLWASKKEKLLNLLFNVRDACRGKYKIHYNL
jgi:hypothetical protein